MIMRSLRQTQFGRIDNKRHNGYNPYRFWPWGENDCIVDNIRIDRFCIFSLRPHHFATKQPVNFPFLEGIHP